MRTLATALALLLVPGLASPAAGQRCGVVQDGAAATFTAAGGYARYDIGPDGPIAGADLAVAAGPVGLRAGYRAALLDPDPAHLATLVAGVPLVRAPAMAFCATAHGGAAVAAIGEDATTSLAGGAGLRLVVGDGPVVTYIEVRGLAGRTSGEVWGVDVDLTGYAVGGEAGLHAALGAFTFRLSGALDGFDEGLGLTPYPAAAVEAGLGLAF